MRHAILCLLATCACAAETVLLADDFADQDLSAPVAWTELRPGAKPIAGKDGERAVALTAGACLLSPALAGGGSYTIRFRGSATYSAPVRCVFLYQDENNYWSFGLGAQARGVFRKHRGTEVRLDDDAQGALTLPHQGGAAGIYKVHVSRTDGALTVAIDRLGDDVDYDVWVTERDPALQADFPADRFGFACGGKDKAAGSVAALEVTAGRRSDARATVTWHVDAERGDDARAPELAQVAATPWRSIQKAAEVARAGDVVLVGPGIYRETVVPEARGGADAPITFRAADPARRPVISGSAPVNPGAWETVEITDFRGNKRSVVTTAVESLPKMLYQRGRHLMVAQEPNQPDALDPYDLKHFMPLAQAPSADRLVDTAFLVQTEPDYWRGATLLLWDSFPNAIGEKSVEAYDPQTHALRVKPFEGTAIGNAEKEGKDAWALRGHLGLLDQPGEFHLDRSVQPSRLYVIPYPDQPPASIEGAVRAHGFHFAKGREHIVVDGFVVRDCASHGVAFGRDARRIAIRNCDLVANMESGISGRFVSDIAIERCLMRENRDNGTNFANCRRVSIIGCEITANGDNGMWFGGGQPELWNSSEILVRGCRIHHQSARRRHPDNYQMHQCRDVLLEGNIFVQTGEQNMWCQYSDSFTLRNNVFVGGTLGINSAIRSRVLNNVFWRSSLRYSRHLDNHPQNKDRYKPQDALIRNNVFVDSSIEWPDPRLVDRFKAFTVDHNYYRIANPHARSSWEWNGRTLALRSDSVIVAGPELPADGWTAQAAVSTTWGRATRLLLLYRDPDNHYWLGVGAKSGLWRRMAGSDVCLFPDPGKKLLLPHQAGAAATYRIAIAGTTEGLAFAITRGKETEPVTVVDGDSAARALFTAGRFGVQTPGPPDGRATLSEVRLEGGGATWNDEFADADIAVAARPDEPVWTVVAGGVDVRNRGGSGVGHGAGSIVAADDADLAAVFRSLPDADGNGFDFRPAPGSPLVEAGAEADVPTDLEGRTRPQGKAVDIGAYESAP